MTELVQKENKITQSQYDEIVAMFKAGAIYEHILAHLDITYKEAYVMKQEGHEKYDPLFVRALEIGTIHSVCHYVNTREDGDARIWMAMMKNNFGWNGNKLSHVPQLQYNPDNPAKAMDSIIQAVARDEISPEKAKVLTDTIINSYNVRQIEQD